MLMPYAHGARVAFTITLRHYYASFIATPLLAIAASLLITASYAITLDYVVSTLILYNISPLSPFQAISLRRYYFVITLSSLRYYAMLLPPLITTRYADTLRVYYIASQT